MKTAILVLAVTAATTASPSLAQSDGTGRSGPRLEVKVGLDRPTFDLLAADDTVTYRGKAHKDGVAYGGEIGYDQDLGSVVLGAYAGIEGSTVKECTSVLGGDQACLRAGRNLALGARAGVKLDGTFMAYVKGGYSNGRAALGYTDYTDPDLDFRLGRNLDGYHVGGGLEVVYAPGVYSRLDYTFTNYENLDYRILGAYLRADTSRHQVTYSLGYRF